MTSLAKRSIHLSKNDAISEIVATLDPAICATCTKRIFRECALRRSPETASEERTRGGRDVQPSRNSAG